MNLLAPTTLRIVFWLSFTATVYTYFLYPLGLLAVAHCRRRIRKNDLPTDELSDVNLPTVTMVISAYNEEKTLEEKLANCRLLDYPHSKITFLIGSDGSDDQTGRILDSVKDSRFVTLVNPDRGGKVKMLNTLLPRTKSDIVIFSDANTMYMPNAIRELVCKFRDKRVGCVIGKLVLTPDPSDEHTCAPEGMYWRYENHIKKLESMLGVVSSINGGIFAIRRELYVNLPSHTVTEDQVLGMKIMSRGRRCVQAEGALAYEHVSNWAGELKRRIRISAGNFQSLFLVPQILNPACGWVSFAFVSHKLLRWLVPFFLLGMLAANVMLVGEPFYGATLIMQGLFYIGATLGAALPNLSGAFKILVLPRYFLTMNLAIMIGLTRFIRKRQRVTWAKTVR